LIRLEKEMLVLQSLDDVLAEITKRADHERAADPRTRILAAGRTGREFAYRDVLDLFQSYREQTKGNAVYVSQHTARVKTRRLAPQPE